MSHSRWWTHIFGWGIVLLGTGLFRRDVLIVLGGVLAFLLGAIGLIADWIPRRGISDEPSPMPQPTTWPDGWYPLDASMAVLFERELRNELHRSHALYGFRTSALARRHDRDDALFFVCSDPPMFAQVHLTWSQKTERYATYPKTKLYPRFEDWVAQQWPEPA